jgi:cation:H+ antiporter
VLLSIGLIVLGIVLLVIGGEALLRGAVGLATLLKLTPAVIGLTVVAAGTSVPELAVSAIAAAQGQVEIAVANVVGSNIFNIVVIVGLCAIASPMAITGNTIKLEYPVLALVTLLCVVLCYDGIINQLEGLLFVTTYVAFTAYLVRLVRQQVTAEERKELTAEVAELTPDTKRPRPLLSTALVFVGVILLAAGAQSTVAGAVKLALLIGMSERVIGLTIVSAGTGLPEVVASFVSSLRGRSDIAIGNVIGSNLFNILATLGLTSLVAPLTVTSEIINNDNWWMLGTTLLLFPVMFSGRRVNRWEGALFLALYGIYIGLLLAQ